MQDRATRTLETLGALYATAFGIEHWPRALDGVAELIGGNGALLFVHDPRPAELQIAATSSRYKALHVEQYLRSLAKDDELRWVRVLDQVAPRTIQGDADIWPDRETYDAMPSVRFLRELNLYHRVAVRPCAHGGWKDSLTVLFDDRRGGIRPIESRRLSLLVPHLARAIETQRPFRLLQRRFGGVLAVLDRLGIGVVVLQERGEIVLANEEAARILEAKDGLRRSPGERVAAGDEETDARLRAAVLGASRAAQLEQPAEGITLEIPRRSGGEAYLVDVVPLRDYGDEMGAAFSGVLLLLIDPDHREMVSTQGLAKTYGLSPMETVVCRMLAQGLTLQEIADTRGVSFDTVKTQVRAVYAKTQTRSRGELVRRAMSIVPPLVNPQGKRIN